MGVRIVGQDAAACLFDSVSGWAFGPVFDSVEQADSFLEYLKMRDGRDARVLKESEMARIYNDFLVFIRCYRCDSEMYHESGAEWQCLTCQEIRKVV